MHELQHLRCKDGEAVDEHFETFTSHMLKGGINDEDLRPSAERAFLATLPVVYHSRIRREYAANKRSHEQVNTWGHETPLQHMYLVAMEIMGTSGADLATPRSSQRRGYGRSGHVNNMQEVITEVADINQQDPCKFCTYKGKPNVKHCEEACFEVGNRRSRIPLEIRLADIDPWLIRFYHEPGNNVDINKSIGVFGTTPTELASGNAWKQAIQQIMQNEQVTLKDLIPCCTTPNCPAKDKGAVKTDEAKRCETVIGLRALKQRCARIIWKEHSGSASTLANINLILCDAHQCHSIDYGQVTSTYLGECIAACDTLGLSESHRNAIYGDMK